MFERPLMLLFDRPRAEVEADLLLALNHIQLEISLFEEQPGCGEFGYSFVDHPVREGLYSKIFADIRRDDILVGLEIGVNRSNNDGHVSESVRRAGLAEAASFGTYLQAKAVLWKPSNTVSGFPYFCEGLEQFENGGPFPILCTVHFDMSDAGRVLTDGLGWFCGQEIEFRDSDIGPNQMIRRCVRLANQMILGGPYYKAIEVPDLEEGNMLRLLPSNDLNMLNVSILCQPA